MPANANNDWWDDRDYRHHWGYGIALYRITLLRITGLLDRITGLLDRIAGLAGHAHEFAADLFNHLLWRSRMERIAHRQDFAAGADLLTIWARHNVRAFVQRRSTAQVLVEPVSKGERFIRSHLI